MRDLARCCLVALDAIDGEWKVERLLNMPDALMLARRQHLGWISHRDPTDLLKKIRAARPPAAR